MRFDPDLVRSTYPMSWPLVESGLWIRLGISGVAVALAAPFLAFSGEVAPLSAAIAFLAGTLLAMFSYRRTHKLLGAEGALAALPTTGRSPIAGAHAA